MCWPPKSPLKVPWRSQTLGSLGDLQRTSLGRHVPAGRLLGLCKQPSLQSPPKISYSTPVNFHVPIPSLLVHKIIHTITTSTLFLYILANFHLTIFAHIYPNSLHQKCFPYLSHLASSGSVKGSGS